MNIKAKYVANVTHFDNCIYTIEYYPITDDGINYGIKSIMYENDELTYTEILQLNLHKSKIEEIIELCCRENVFPYTIIDVVTDMSAVLC